jgi:carboxymethylenebutenolidase
VLPHNRQWADRLAEAGYLSLVIDLYDGRVTDDSEQAAQWMREVDQAAADRKLTAAIEFLSAPGRCLAVYGCSFGGKQAMRGPVLTIYAQQERNWPQKQEDFETAMQAAGKLTEAHGYDAAHGFTNPASPRYDAEADAAAWQTLLDFLARQIG